MIFSLDGYESVVMTGFYLSSLFLLSSIFSFIQVLDFKQ